MPPVCEEHGQFYREGQRCSKCGVAEYNKVKKENKEAIQAAKIYQKSTRFKGVKIAQTQKALDRAKLMLKLQNLWSKHFKKWAKENDLYYDWITDFKNEGKGLYSFHVSHYFAKSTYWQLWTNPINSGILTYDQNVNKPHNIAAMRSMMVFIHGESKVKELEKLQEHFDKRLKTGIDPKHPTDIWLIGKIAELSNKDYYKNTFELKK